MKLVWSPRAIRHLVHLREYIAKNSEQNATLVASRLLKAVELLQTQPNGPAGADTRHSRACHSGHSVHHPLPVSDGSAWSLSPSFMAGKNGPRNYRPRLCLPAERRIACSKTSLSARGKFFAVTEPQAPRRGSSATLSSSFRVVKERHPPPERPHSRSRHSAAFTSEHASRDPSIVFSFGVRLAGNG